MFDEEITDGKSVVWRDPQNVEIYGSGPGPFYVETTKEEEVVPVCTCGGQGGGLFDDGHSPLCEIRAKKVVATMVTVRMNGRLRSFDEELFELWNGGEK